MGIARPTPVMQQYLAVKREHPEAILFFRMGDFYEMFYEDAEIASRELEIALTSRNKNEESPVPMCGVPCRSASGYIARLIERGYKVALCDQMEDASAAKGLVRREVVRVITPGMILDEEFLDAKTPNFLAAVVHAGGLWGLARLDLSTGEFRATESERPEAIEDEARRIAPREILLPDSAKTEARCAWIRKALAEAAFTYFEDRAFEPSRARDYLASHFGTLNLEGFGCAHLRAAVAAAGGLLRYVAESQRQKTAHVLRLEPYALEDALILDEQSRRNLELVQGMRSGGRRGSLLAVIDHTCTPLGARTLRRWLLYPLVRKSEIDRRLDAVAEGREKASLRRQLRALLEGVYDLERLGSRVVMGQANARDLLALGRSLAVLPRIQEGLHPFEAELLHSTESFDGLEELSRRIQAAIREDAPPVLNEGGLIREGYHAELDELIRIATDARGALAAIEAREREATGIASLKVGYNRVFGYYIEIPRSRVKDAPGRYIRKQTLVNAERFITEELKAFEARALGAEQERIALENRLFLEIRDEAARLHTAIQAAAGLVSRIDALLSLAEAAERRGYVRPEIYEDGRLRIDDGRHPVIETLIPGGRFVPNSIRLDDEENQVLIITGPNMAGKSTVLRQTALIAILAQMGSFVPARRAEVGILDRIFTRVGALDNLAEGQSTFMVEMQETANILNNATARSLVVLDEIGRGTSTYDGLSIAWAVAEYLHDWKGRGVKTLFATHYHELTELAETRPRVRNFNIAVREWNDDIIFLHKLVPGGTNRSYGIQVARLAGVPRTVIERAKSILRRIESGGRVNLGESAEPPPVASSLPVQLDLFGAQEKDVLEELRRADIDRLTPIEAMNLLHRLQQKIGGKAP
ncbi:MAG: DNA mismatch repair protein MutS [Desulfobacterales bacterium]